MRIPTGALALGLALTAVAQGLSAQERYERKGNGEWKYEFRDRTREVKREGKADGEWKEEIKDANCEVKREFKRNGEYKEEVNAGERWSGSVPPPSAREPAPSEKRFGRGQICRYARSRHEAKPEKGRTRYE